MDRVLDLLGRQLLPRSGNRGKIRLGAAMAKMGGEWHDGARADIAAIDCCRPLIGVAAEHPMRRLAEDGRVGLAARQQLSGGLHRLLSRKVTVVKAQIRFGAACLVADHFVLNERAPALQHRPMVVSVNMVGIQYG